MAVETTISRAQYNTNGTTGPWTVPFLFLADSDLTVIYTDSESIDTELALGVGFSVVGAGTGTGTVTTTNAYVSGGRVTILRNMEPLQESDYTDGDPLPAETLERDFDRPTMLIQEVLEKLGRALIFPAADVSPPAALGGAALRANGQLLFDGAGQPFVGAPASGSAADLLLQLISGTLTLNLLRVKAGGGGGADYNLSSYLNNRLITGHADYGFLENSRVQYLGGAPIYGHASFNDNISFIGNVNSDHHHSYQSYPHYGTAAQILTLSSFWSQPDVTNGSVVECSGLKFNNPFVTAPGNIQNVYGVLIGALTAGTNNNIGVAVLGASGAVGTNSAFYSSGLDVTSYFGGRIGMGRGSTGYGSDGYNPNTGDLTRLARAGGTYGSRFSNPTDDADHVILLGNYNDGANTCAQIKKAALPDGRLTLTPALGTGILLAGTVEISGAVVASLPIIHAGYTVATLPSAVTYARGRAFVTDANSTTFNTAAVGGGANIMPVHSKGGAGWFIG